jgi:hypothetical protein
MHPEVSKYEEKKVFLEDVLNLKPDVSEGGKKEKVILGRNTLISFNLCHDNVLFWTYDTLFWDKQQLMIYDIYF